MAANDNDTQVVAILDAYTHGVTKRADVAARVGISVRKYDQGRKRLMRLVDKLPAMLDAGGGMTS